MTGQDAASPADRKAVEEWPAGPLPREEWLPVLLQAGVWLVFLSWPLIAIVTGEAAPGWKVLGCAGLAVFVAVYLGSYLRPWLVSACPHWTNTLAITVVLLLCVLAVVPAGGLYAFNCLPFILAVWIFPHPLTLGLPVAVSLAAVGITAAWVVGGAADPFWMYLPTGLALLIMVALRLAMEREENSRMLNEQLALSRQREQFGRDVHDVLGHSLTVITLKAELAHRLVETDPGRARAELDGVLEISRQSLAEVRSTVGGLHLPDLGSQLTAARTALDAAGITASIPPASAVSGLPPARQELFAWSLREAITNVVRHSGATRCTVTVTPDRLTVTDDGVGLDGSRARGSSAARPGDPTPAAPPGQGLPGMRRRIAEAGGTLTLTEARPGRDRPGTRLEATL